MYVAQTRDSSLILEINSSSSFSFEKATNKALIIKLNAKISSSAFVFTKVKYSLLVDPVKKLTDSLANAKSLMLRKFGSNSKIKNKIPRIKLGIKIIHPISIKRFGSK